MSDMKSTLLPKARQTPQGTVLARPFNSTTSEIPQEAEVVVIGGGISGVTTAWFLARQGISVTIFEKGEIGGESSSRAFGWISELLLDPIKMELSSESKRLWKMLQEECGELGFRQDGIVYLADTEEEMAFYTYWLEEVKDSCAPENVLLSPSDLKKRFPRSDKNWVGGILAPTDGFVEPTIATTVIAESAQKMGAKIITNCAVRTVEKQSGKVSGLHTEQGYIKTNKVLYAGNAWSRLFCGNMGIDVPQLTANMTMARTGPLENGPQASGGTRAHAWRRRIDNSYTLGSENGIKVPLTRDFFRLFSRFIPFIRQDEEFGATPSLGKDAFRDWGWPRKWSKNDITPFEKHRVLPSNIYKSAPHKSLELNREAFPDFNDTAIEEYWSGTLTITPDNMPIASSIASIPGFFLITGSSYGLTWAPALGKLLSDMITDRQPSIDPSPYRYERFTDGSDLKITY